MGITTQVITQQTVVEGYIKSMSPAEGAALRERLPILQKMGLYDPTKSAEVSTDVAAVADGTMVRAAKTAIKAAEGGVSAADATGIGKDIAREGLEAARGGLVSAQKSQIEAGKQVAQAVGLGPLMMFAENGFAANSPLGNLIKNTPVQTLMDPKMTPLLQAIGDRVKSNPAFSQTLDKQLASDPKLADRFKKDLMEKPDAMAVLVRNYKPETLGVDLAKVDGQGEVKVVVPPAPKKPAPVVVAAPNAPVAPQTSAPAPSGKLEPMTVAGSAAVLAMAESISASVKDNFPELGGDADSFLATIQSDPVLQNKIKTQLDKNPDFVKQLDGMKSAGALSPKVKSNLRPFVQKFLHNPQALGTEEGMKQTVADFNKAKGAAQTAGMEEMLSKWGIDLKGMPGFFSGAAGQAMAGVEQVAYGFSGGDSGISRPVLSFRTSGGSMFPSLMINLANFRSNQAAGAAFARYSPEDMTAYGIMKDGKPTHQEAVMGADGKPALDKDGKPVFKEVPNTMTVKTASGKEEKIIPAVGVLMAMQEKGSYAADGTWKPGNYRVPVVNNINSAGASTSIKNIIMTEEQFMKFKEDMRVASGGRNFPSEPYTQQDALAAGIRPDVRAGGVRMATVDPSTGAVAEPKMEYPAGPQPSGATTYPVRDPKVESRPLAANDRDYELQG